MASITTVGDLLNDTIRHLLGVSRGEANTVSNTTAVATTDTTVFFQYQPNGIARNSFINIDDELLFIWSVDTVANSAVVQRGMRGTVAASHAAGTWIDVNPRFPNYMIRAALQEEIRSWPHDLFQVKTLDITAGPASTQQPNQVTVSRAYDLTGMDPNFYFGVELQHSPKAFSDTWFRVKRWRIERLPTSGPSATGSTFPISYFPSGLALIVMEYIYTGQMRLSYASPFDVDTVFTDATDVVNTIGLHRELLDIPPLGAAWRLLATREVRRTFVESQGQSRHAEEVPPEEIMKAALSLKGLRDNRLAQEVQRIRTRYPVRTLGA